MKVSVVIPVFNGEKVIGECIEALLNQETKHNYEIIVVNDGSRDRTEKIVKEMQEKNKGKKNKKIKYLFQENKGPAHARNNGAGNATGEIIIFTDADCVASPNMVEELVKPIEESKGEIVGVQGSYKTKQRELVARFGQIEIEERYRLMEKKKYIDFIGTYCCAYDKKVFLEAGGFDTGFTMASGEDPELSYKLAREGRKLVFNRKAFCYHTHPNSLWKYLRTKYYRAYWRIPLYSKHKGKIVKDSYTPQSLKLQIGSLGVFCIGLIGAVFNGFMQYFMLLGIFIFIISSLKSIIFALKRDFLVGICSPVVILLRTLVFTAGLGMGMLRKVIK